METYLKQEGKVQVTQGRKLEGVQSRAVQPGDLSPRLLRPQLGWVAREMAMTDGN